MKPVKRSGRCIILLVIAGLLGIPAAAPGELQWPSAKMEPLRLHVIALAWNHPRSSVFASEEVFIAEKELSKDETQLVKLVYGFLPYQPRLSENVSDYSTVHELRAARDPSCDETLAQIATGKLGDWRDNRLQLKYYKDAPPLNASRIKRSLPCYVTSADDYNRPVHEPAHE